MSMNSRTLQCFGRHVLLKRKGWLRNGPKVLGDDSLSESVADKKGILGGKGRMPSREETVEKPSRSRLLGNRNSAPCYAEKV